MSKQTISAPIVFSIPVNTKLPTAMATSRIGPKITYSSDSRTTTPKVAINDVVYFCERTKDIFFRWNNLVYDVNEELVYDRDFPVFFDTLIAKLKKFVKKIRKLRNDSTSEDVYQDYHCMIITSKYYIEEFHRVKYEGY